MLSTLPTRHKHHRVIIVGAGPGGLQLGYFLGRANVDYVILDRASYAGSFFEHLPVHRTLLSINKINTGCSDLEKNFRWDWNSLISDDLEFRLSQYDPKFFPTADSLVLYLRDFCERMKIRAQFNCDVLAIGKQDGKFLLQTTWDGGFTCDLLIVATGMSVPFTPDIAGVELAECYTSYDRSIESCRNKDILVIGKGNSAFETAQDLLPNAARIHLISPGFLQMAWQSHFPGNLRQINSPFLETFLLKQQNAVLNGTIHSLERVGDKLAASITWTENGHKAKFAYDRVILCTGFRFDASPFANEAKPELIYNGKLPELTSHWESANISGLYFCGSLMQANDYKKSASAFVHGMRYNARTLSKLIEARLSNRPYPAVTVSLDTEVLFSQIYERIRRASSLWHMHGSLCDAYVYDGDRAQFDRLEDVPVRMMKDDGRFRATSRIEFRFTFENPKDLAEQQNFSPTGLLHPALYFFVRGDLISECHMYEDVYAEWEDKEVWGGRFLQALAQYVGGLGAAKELARERVCQ
jgi:thioredoxin reductase